MAKEPSRLTESRFRAQVLCTRYLTSYCAISVPKASAALKKMCPRDNVNHSCVLAFSMSNSKARKLVTEQAALDPEATA